MGPNRFYVLPPSPLESLDLESIQIDLRSAPVRAGTIGIRYISVKLFAEILYEKQEILDACFSAESQEMSEPGERGSSQRLTLGVFVVLKRAALFH